MEYNSWQAKNLPAGQEAFCRLCNPKVHYYDYKIPPQADDSVPRPALTIPSGLFPSGSPTKVLSVYMSALGRTDRNEHSKIWRTGITSVIGPLAASSFSNAISAHAHLLRSRHGLRDNGCHRQVSSTYCHWISCERGKLVRSHLRATS
jgi:hypothetical protein